MQKNQSGSSKKGSDSTVGMGLANTRNRLMNLYEEYKFELSSSTLGGLRVLVELPFGLQKHHSVSI
jgi:sensor histidine kinase YesM